MYTFLSLWLVTKIRPSGVFVITLGLDKQVIILPVKRPSKENCWTRLFPESHTKRLLELSTSNSYGVVNYPSWFPSLPNLYRNVPDLSKALMQWLPPSDTRNMFLLRMQQFGYWSFSRPLSPNVKIDSPSFDITWILLFPHSQQCVLYHPQ